MLTSPSTAVTPTSRPPMGYLEQTEETAYGTILTRVTGISGTPLTIGGKWGTDSRLHYSKDEPWNDDQTMIWIEQRGAEPSKIILDAQSFAPIYGNKGTTKNLNTLALSHECRWRPGYPRQMVSWLKTGQVLVIWDVLNDQILKTIPVPSDDANFGWLSEGTISDDGRWTVLGTTWDSPQTYGRKDYVVVVDLEIGQAGPPSDVSMFTLKYPTSKYGKVGNINISTRGNYVMGKMAGSPEYGFVLKVNKSNLTAIPQPMDPLGLRMKETRADLSGFIACLSHADMNEFLGGRECVIGGLRDAEYSNHCSGSEKDQLGTVVAVDLANGAHIHVSAGKSKNGGLKEASDQHTSGRAYKLRQKGTPKHLVTYACPMETSGQFTDEMVLYDTDGSGNCTRFGVTRTNDQSEYRAEAHGCPSPDGSKVMFASNWQGGWVSTPGPSGEAKSYTLSLKDGPPPPDPEVPPPPTPRYAIDKAWSYSPDGGIVDQAYTPPRLVSLPEIARIMNAWNLQK